QNPYRDIDALLADCTYRAILDAVTDEKNLAGLRTPADFADLSARIAPIVRSRAPEYFDAAVAALAEYSPVRRAIDARTGTLAADDVADQLANLIFDGFIGATSLTHLRALPRYLTAARLRLEALPSAGNRDNDALAAIDRVIVAWNRREAQLPASRHAALADLVQWRLEELRVSLFAQQLGTSGSVSEQRIIKAIDKF
ncbi:DUF3418 domain-containing protein, partial [Gordonia sp. (in: high G+C Gram-positive bacteria)]|uniref:DUF3418 domain-containing protein n=1 Tax=Gordonia sp. (in: high G+C Gram-positive bacteria) TaxID=84139 RepID=UPI0016B126AE